MMPPPPSILRPLGSSELKVSPIGLGCWQLGDQLGPLRSMRPQLSSEVVRDLVEASVAGGVNFFDTAERYGGGRSEESLARALHQTRMDPEHAVVATKWWPLLRSASSIHRTIDDRIASLGGYPISLHQIHNPFSVSSLRAQLRQMARLARLGKIQYVGVSNFSARLMRKANEILKELGLSLVANQVSYSLLHRHAEFDGTLDAAKELGISIIAHSPLAQGLLSGKFHLHPSMIKSRPDVRRIVLLTKGRLLQQSESLVQALFHIATRHDATPSQVALSWLIQFHGPIVVAIPGASTARQARENAGAMRLVLSGEELQQLDLLSQQFGGQFLRSLQRSFGKWVS